MARKPKRYYVAAPDATPAQIAMNGGFRSQAIADDIARTWNAKYPECPVVVFVPRAD